MGGSGFSFELPLAPTAEEMKAWKEWVAGRQAKMDGNLKEQHVISTEGETANMAAELSESARKRILQTAQAEQPSYQPSPFSTEADIALFFKTRCDQEFRSNGFPRVTFNWNLPSLPRSKWNTATADILADQWKFWYERHQLLSAREAPNIDVKAVINRWMKYAAKNPTKKAVQKSQDAAVSMKKAESEKAKSEAAAARLKKRNAVARLRLEALEVYSPRKQCTALTQMICAEAISDYEEDVEDARGVPTRVVPFWRSERLTSLMHMLDLASFQLADAARKKQLTALLLRSASRDANEDETAVQQVPHDLPQEAYSHPFLSDLSPLERSHLGVYVPSSSEATLSEALEAFQELTQIPGPVPSSSSRAMCGFDTMLSRKRRKTFAPIDV